MQQESLNILWDYPPYPYLKQVLEHCPKSASLYMDLWESRNKESSVQIKKDEIKSRFFTSLYLFETSLMKLVKEGLVSVDEKRGEYNIELTRWDEIETDD